MEITMATIGRLMKNFDMGVHPYRFADPWFSATNGLGFTRTPVRIL
jgi:hypothetical protein